MSQEPTTAGLLGIHALTPLHPGAGTALGTVDLPVQRERHTHWPNIAGSALKGILRDACRELVKKDHNGDRTKANEAEVITTLFGPPQGSSQDAAAAGAVSITDARLLAFPVRSLKGVFAWVTCPAVMERFARDCKLAGLTASNASALKPNDALSAMIPSNCPCKVGEQGKTQYLLLEEFKLDVVTGDPTAWAEWVASRLLPTSAEYQDTITRFDRQLVVVHDDDFSHFVKYATEVTARIGLDYETKTVKGGALFYQEFLPTETLLYSVLIVNSARARGEQKSAATLMPDLAKRIADIPNSVLQIGGDETTGKGYCSVRLTTGGAK
ncbi:type III-B CRISPR module RAMP protein Cmr4 [Gemmata sp. JC673]|uniref:Type III-B CRISPR module RAMP protein Cmr4 n=1 Tax=Gemmata algarum TaxID=2975278 RepID=A0ABU5F667_9BACT|nr:type III-B CRISPR module RAMP protein Cmr4 [Gemmata algarum]MDY3562989.1 type III-B CRISPR module RAMP protein Cmr4 [Gemmata algarum]